MSEPQLTNDDDALGADRSLLIVEDDRPFLTRLARAMESRGFAVDTAESVEEALAKVKAGAPAYAVVDMRLGDGNGIDVVAAIREKRGDARTIILTGYGNIATAVTAVKLGAVANEQVLHHPAAVIAACSLAAAFVNQRHRIDAVEVLKLLQQLDAPRLVAFLFRFFG